LERPVNLATFELFRSSHDRLQSSADEAFKLTSADNPDEQTMNVATLSLLPHQQSDAVVHLPYANFHELLKAKTELAPARDFLIFPETDRRYTYQQFYEISLGASEWLSSRVKDFGTICIIFRNTPEFLAIYFGAVARGISVVPINHDLAAAEIRFIIENSDCAAVFYDPHLEGKIASLKREMTVAFHPFANVANLPPSDPKKAEANLPKVDPNTPAVIIYTSGTTGNPKGVVLSHMNFIVDGMAIAGWFEFTPATRSLCILPLFHNNGIVISTTTTLCAGGSIVIVDPKASLRSFWALVDRYQATFTSVMPSILAALLTLSFEGKRGQLQGIICGGQLLPLSLAHKFESRFGVPIFEGFGSTEASSYSSFNRFPADRRKLGSVGTVLPVCEMRVVDDNDNEVPDGTEGELCIRGPNVAIGYHKLPELNAQKFRNGWYHSGDYGLRDKEGNYYFRSRKDDLIVKGGEKIYPAEIENVLSQHPDVILGQEICAFARLQDATATTENDLLKFCGQSLARFKQPKRIVIINRLGDMPELPKGPTKKILYRVLRDYYDRRLTNIEDPEGLKTVLGS
jgi:acyl-CoA synthetase (AMP-forming)/AMP-acid ligase II